jgi:MurNAc alpha-1-phosphate uridylyltransferase
MILAAGRGERMRPLTEHTPKPLLQVGGRCLLDYHLEQLAEAGIRDIVINVSHLADQVESFVGGGERWGCRVQLSREAEPLETAGGLIQALSLLGEAPFAVVNADTWTDYPRAGLRRPLGEHSLAHLVLVDNPPQHSRGDFLLDAQGRVQPHPGDVSGTLTYAGLGVYSPALFDGCEPGKRPLLPLLEAAMAQGRLTGEHYRGEWHDVGTPQRLAALDARLRGVL